MNNEGKVSTHRPSSTTSEELSVDLSSGELDKQDDAARHDTHSSICSRDFSDEESDAEEKRSESSSEKEDSEQEKRDMP